jgi:hypothetical protein
MNPAQIAKICHEANRALCENQGDYTQRPWDDAEDWQRESALDGVLFHLAHPEAGPSAGHQNWLAQKEREGWKYGEVKNPERKEHPCFVPFAELPPEQQAKDYLFQGIVAALASFVEGAEKPPEYTDPAAVARTEPLTDDDLGHVSPA